MGRRKIEIQPITHERNRSVTFLKRKNGLFKKAYELGVLCSVDVAVIIFEERAGHHVKLHEYCSTDVDRMVQRHLHFDGEKESKGPPDFSNKPDVGEEEGDDEDDEEGGKRRDSLKGGKVTTKPRDPARMLPVKSSSTNMGLGLDDYRQDPRQMSLPQAPLHHLQIPTGSLPMSQTSPGSYTSASLPVSLERHIPGSGNLAKKPRLDPAYPYGLDDPAASSPSYRVPGASQMFTPHSAGPGPGGGGANPGSPTHASFFPHSLGFPRQSPRTHSGASGGFPGSAGAGAGPGSAYGLYTQNNPFAALLGSGPGGSTPPSSASPHGHVHGHHGHHMPFDPLEWPSHAQRSSQPANVSPHPSAFPARPQSQPGAGAGGASHDWLDFLSNAGPQALPAAGTAASSISSGGSEVQGRVSAQDSWERGQSGLGMSPHLGQGPTQSEGGGGLKRARSESSQNEDGDGSAKRPELSSSAEVANVANGNSGTDGNRDGDAQSDASASGDPDRKRQRWAADH